MSSSSFVSEIVVSEKLMDLLREVSRDLAMRSVMECGKQYNFNGEEAIRVLGLGEVSVKMSKGKSLKSENKVKSKVEKVKSSFPLPFSGVLNENSCHGLKNNHGLYTQCASKKSEGDYCVRCGLEASKNASGKPDNGTVEDRLSVGLYEYKDAKGKSPIAYTKLMKKLNLSKEEVLMEASKMRVEVPSEHFEVVALEGKRGRPKMEKVEKEPKGAKGRPKKTKKVLELSEEEDLFSMLVSKANSDVSEETTSCEESSNSSSKAAKESDKAADKAALKAAKEAAKEAEKAAVKAAKEAAKAAEKAAVKAAKESAKAAAKEASKKPLESLPVAIAVAVEAKVEESKVDEEEADVVKRIDYEGKKYLKSKKTGIIYNMDQDVVGKWNNETKKIDFMEEEECESEYEE